MVHEYYQNVHNLNYIPYLWRHYRGYIYPCIKYVFSFQRSYGRPLTNRVSIARNIPFAILVALCIGKHDHERKKDGTIMMKPNKRNSSHNEVPILDTTGKYVMLGGIDPHTHLEFSFMGQVTIDDIFLV
jgi:hypothetical protein